MWFCDIRVTIKVIINGKHMHIMLRLGYGRKKSLSSSFSPLLSSAKGNGRAKRVIVVVNGLMR